MPGCAFFKSNISVVITGTCPKTIGFSDILSRLIKTLSHPNHAKLESELNARLEAVTASNASETAQWLLDIVGFPIEARWHAADSSLNRLSGNKKIDDTLFKIIRQYVFDNELDATHGTCWKIWALLGTGPRTNYRLPENAAELLLKEGTTAELKRLFGIVFANDRFVLDVLREAEKLLLA